MNVDVSELVAYAQHLESAMDRAEPEFEKVVERGALNVKRYAQSSVRANSRGRYLKHYPRSITYDMLSPLEAEVGPDSAKPQGGMGRGVEFGSANTSPMAHMFPAADSEEPEFTKQALAAFVRGLR